MKKDIFSCALRSEVCFSLINILCVVRFLGESTAVHFCCLLQICTEAHFEDYFRIDEIGKTLFSYVSGFLSYSESEMSGVFRASFLLSFILQIITFSAL